MPRLKRAAVSAVYGAGGAAVLLLLALAAAGPRFIPFPDAMLPMDLRELALAWLAIGFLPMLLASIQFHKIVRSRAVFLPAGACLLAMAFWMGVWTLGALHTLGLRG